MDFFKKLFSAAPPAPRSNFYIFNVKCDRCGETIEGRVNIGNELSLDDGGTNYFVRKVLMGNGHCFQQVEIELHFNASRKLLDKQVHGGTFLE